MDALYPAPRAWGLCLLFAALTLAAQVLEGQAPPGGGYRIGPEDEISIEVLEDEALDVTRRVSPQGTVSLPLLGEVVVAGGTVAEVAARIEAALEASFLQAATVHVSVSAYRSQAISVAGAVAEPGEQYLSGRWTLLQAITAAGGTTAESSGTVFVQRKASNGLSDVIEIDLAALRRHGDETWNVPLMPDDVVEVRARPAITVYFLGEAAAQGAVTLQATERPTLLTAIARAGGLGERAASKLVIRRVDADGRPTEIVANFRKILAGTDPDVLLEDGDFILVKEAFL